MQTHLYIYTDYQSSCKSSHHWQLSHLEKKSQERQFGFFCLFYCTFIMLCLINLLVIMSINIVSRVLFHLWVIKGLYKRLFFILGLPDPIPFLSRVCVAIIYTCDSLCIYKLIATTPLCYLKLLKKTSCLFNQQTSLCYFELLKMSTCFFIIRNPHMIQFFQQAIP